MHLYTWNTSHSSVLLLVNKFNSLVCANSTNRPIFQSTQRIPLSLSLIRMEKTREWKQKQAVVQPRRRSLHKSSSMEEVKLAAIAVSLNVRLRSADMPANLQERALRYTRSLPDSAPADHRPNPTLLARSLKKEFDTWYGPAWHCVVGKSFGSFVTHSPGGFVYFSLDSLSFLLFKTEVQLVTEPLDPQASAS